MEQTASVRDTIALSTRERTPEGFLRGKATVTKVGVLSYDASELGVGPLGQTVRVKQTPDSVFHPDTLRSVQNAVVTVGHPTDGVTPDNWRALAAGTVGSPEKVADSHVGADILFGDRGAIQSVDSGRMEELSIGKRFQLVSSSDADCDYMTVGPISINHVALVERGRAGPDVRVMDTEPGDTPMTPEQMTQLSSTIATAVASGLPTTGAQAVDSAPIVASVTDAIKPLLDSIAATQRQAEEARLKAASDEARTSLTSAFTKGVEDAYKDGYDKGIAEATIRADALSVISDPQVAQAMAAEKDMHKLLVAACGDMAPNAAMLPVETLHGMVMAKRQILAGGGAPGYYGMDAGGYGGGHAPFGNGQTMANQAQPRRVNARDENRRAFEAAIDQTLKTGVVVQPSDVLAARQQGQ